MSGSVVRVLADPAGAESHLVCFPPAGGAASFFADFARLAGLHRVVHSVQYPARQDRIREQPPAGGLPELACQIAAGLPQDGRPVDVFGHSFGATVAYEVARICEVHRPVRWLIASGRSAPTQHQLTEKHRWSDDELWLDMIRMGGTPPELAELPELRGVVVPALRWDLWAIETYRPDPARLRADIAVFRGEQDLEVTREEALAWAQSTRGRFEFRPFPGGHFYLLDDPAAVLDAIDTLTRREG